MKRLRYVYTDGRATCGQCLSSLPDQTSPCLTCEGIDATAASLREFIARAERRPGRAA